MAAKKRKVKIGDQFDMLTVVAKLPSKKTSSGLVTMWQCVCVCGKQRSTQGKFLLCGRTTSCGCKRRGIGDETAFNSVLAEYKSRSKKRGLSFDLTPEQFRALALLPCTYCGKMPSNYQLPHAERSYEHNKPFIYNGLDRVDSNKGYSITNSVPCCWACNTAKSDLTIAEFKQLIVDIYTNMKLGG